MKFIMLFLVTIAVAMPYAKTDNIVMPAIFSDNMVLQQKSSVQFWGKANPGDKIIINATWGAAAKATVNDEGIWKTKVKTIKAGGPYEVKIKIGDSTIIYKNVLLGEVWLCSGQSNMEMPLEGWPPQNVIQNSAQEIKEANYPEIRLFNVAKAVSNKAEFNCVGAWTECNPQTVANFSAAGYFFGREIHKNIKVPVGLISSPWGGTPIEAWISSEYLGKINEYKPIIEKIASVGDGIKKLNDWINSHPVIDVSSKDLEHRWENLNFGDSSCANPEFNDTNWKSMKLPTLWEAAEIGNFDGVVWFRKKVDIPKSWIGKDLVVELGAIDDMDRTYANGTFIGGYEKVGYYSQDRVYTISNELIHDSVLTIAVRVLDNGGGGGIWGNNFKMNIHQRQDSLETISLADNWKYLPVAEYVSNKFYIYKIESEEFNSRPKTLIDVSPNTPTMLYNGMIAPLVPYTIKGALWYQGETNVGRPYNYKDLFPLMIKNWRENWGEGNFPFYFVQIAPYVYSATDKSYIIREAQLSTLSVPNTGMAVTLDIATVNNIHPPDKQDVGKRLA